MLGLLIVQCGRAVGARRAVPETSSKCRQARHAVPLQHVGKTQEHLQSNHYVRY